MTLSAPTVTVLCRRGGLLLYLVLTAASMSMVVPILATSFSDPQHAVMLTGLPPGIRGAAYGVVVGVFPITSFILAPFLGNLSDSLGRKRMLLGGVAGLALSNLAVAGALHQGMLSLLLAGRVIGGISAAATAVAEAAFVDLAQPEERHTFLGYALLSWCIGYAAGPACAAAAAQWNLPGGTPVLLTTVALLALLLLPLIATLPPDAPSMENPANWNVMGSLTGAMKDLAGIFREPGLSSAAWSMLFSRMGTGAYGAFIPLFLIHRLSFGDEDIAWFLSLFGLGSGVAFLIVYPWLSSRFNVRRITTASLWGALAAIAVSLLCRERYLAWLFPVPISIFLSLAYGGIMGVMADAAGEERRGWIFGIAASLDSLALGLGVMLCGLVEAKSESGSMVISLLFFVLAPLVASRLPLPAAKTTIGKGEEPCRSDL